MILVILSLKIDNKGLYIFQDFNKKVKLHIVFTQDFDHYQDKNQLSS